MHSAKEHKFDLVEVFKTVNFPMGRLLQNFEKGDAIPDGATIGIPNDPSNGGRAILVLANAGLIKSQRYQKRYYHRCRYHRKST